MYCKQNETAMKNTKENRKEIIKKQLTKFNKSCYLVCTCYKDNTEELFELPVVNYRAVAAIIADNFRKEHNGFCVCSVCFTDGRRGKCFGV